MSADKHIVHKQGGTEPEQGLDECLLPGRKDKFKETDIGSDQDLQALQSTQAGMCETVREVRQSLNAEKEKSAASAKRKPTRSKSVARHFQDNGGLIGDLSIGIENLVAGFVGQIGTLKSKLLEEEEEEFEFLRHKSGSHPQRADPLLKGKSKRKLKKRKQTESPLKDPEVQHDPAAIE